MFKKITTLRANLESPADLMVAWGSWRTHADTGRTCTLHVEIPPGPSHQPLILLSYVNMYFFFFVFILA